MLFSPYLSSHFLSVSLECRTNIFFLLLSRRWHAIASLHKQNNLFKYLIWMFTVYIYLFRYCPICPLPSANNFRTFFFLYLFRPKRLLRGTTQPSTLRNANVLCFLLAVRGIFISSIYLTFLSGSRPPPCVFMSFGKYTIYLGIFSGRSTSLRPILRTQWRRQSPYYLVFRCSRLKMENSEMWIKHFLVKWMSMKRKQMPFSRSHCEVSIGREGRRERKTRSEVKNLKQKRERWLNEGITRGGRRRGENERTTRWISFIYQYVIKHESGNLITCFVLLHCLLLSQSSSFSVRTEYNSVSSEDFSCSSGLNRIYSQLWQKSERKNDVTVYIYILLMIVCPSQENWDIVVSDAPQTVSNASSIRNGKRKGHWISFFFTSIGQTHTAHTGRSVGRSHTHTHTYDVIYRGQSDNEEWSTSCDEKWPSVEMKLLYCETWRKWFIHANQIETKPKKRTRIHIPTMDSFNLLMIPSEYHSISLRCTHEKWVSGEQCD